MIAAAAGAGAGLVLLTETFSTGFAVDVPELGEPEGGPSSHVPRRPGRASTASGSAGRARRSRPTRRPTTSARPTPSCSPGPTARCTATARSTRSRYAGEEKYVPRRRPSSSPSTSRGCGSACSSATTCASPTSSGSSPRDTDVYLVPANWPAKRRLHWRRCCRRGRSRTRRTSSASTASATGGGLAYTGDSRIVDPLGELLATAAHTETILLADISADHVAETRDHFRFLQDRR